MSSDDGGCVLCEYGRYALYGLLLGGSLAVAYMAADLILDGALSKLWDRPVLAPVIGMRRGDDQSA